MWDKCWWCKEYGEVPIRAFTLHGCQSISVKYCPVCGKPQTEEAYEELKKKLYSQKEN